MKDWVHILAAVLLSYPLFLLLRVILIAPYQLYKKLRAEKEKIQTELDLLSRKETESVLGIFDLSARDAVEYVKKELLKGVSQAEEFLTQMAIEGRVHIRAIERDRAIDSPIAPEAIASHNWAVKKLKVAFDYPLSYQAPRFVSKEVEEVIKWYKASRPCSSS